MHTPVNDDKQGGVISCPIDTYLCSVGGCRACQEDDML